MYHIKEDPRQKKSADLITEGMLSLLCDSALPPQKTPTIADICRKAGVSRATFYRLFDSPDDILSYYFDTIFDNILECCADKKRAGVPYSPAEVYSTWFTEHQRSIAGMLRHGKIHILMEAHRKALYRHADTLFPEMDKDSDEFTFFSEMRTGVLAGAARAWFRTGRQAGPADLIAFCDHQLRFHF